ncbi:MAG: thiamine pyrophosphate-dependent enzyme, partial [Pseudomonadota bacterium]
HENAGGFMAEGTYHATGAPGILLATIGPGIANAVNVAANALQDRVPLIVISGCVDASTAMTYTHQVCDHRAMMAPVVRAGFTAVDGAIEETIDKAIAIATDSPPGPVHIDLPIAVAAAEQPARSYPPRAANAALMPAPGPELDAARAMLAAAERPLVIAGMDVLFQRSEAAVARFCRDRRIPLLTTYKAKGILPEDYPLALGGHGLSPLSDRYLMPLIEQADLVISAGYDPIEMRDGWRNPWDPAKVVEFRAVANDHYVHQAKHTFLCDVGAGLDALGLDVAVKPVWSNGEPDAVRAALADAFAGGEGWGPHMAFRTLREALPRETVATADSGAHRILLSQIWPCFAPRTLLQSTAFCTMGCAVPIAIGYKQASPQTPVIAFVGDAGLEMILGELATLRDLRLPVLICVLVDESLALIERKQRAMGYDNTGVDFGLTDFAAVAEAVGGHGVAISDAATLAAEAAAALGRDTFTVLACHIGRKAYEGAF